MASVLAENEELRQGQLERLRQHADSNLGPMGPLNAELLAEMNERVEVRSCVIHILCCQRIAQYSENARKKMLEILTFIAIVASVSFNVLTAVLEL